MVHFKEDFILLVITYLLTKGYDHGLAEVTASSPSLKLLHDSFELEGFDACSCNVII